MSSPQQTKLVEVYGFAGWIVSAISYVCFLLWAFLPENYLHELGVTYYPAKYWSLGLPAFVTMGILLTIVSYVATTCIRTPAWEQREAWTDPHACPLPSADEASIDTKVGTPEISDLPLTIVNSLMFEDDDEEN